MPEAPALLFDLDNTLVDRDAAFRRYLADFLARHPRVFAAEEVADAQREILALDAHGRKPRARFCAEVLQRYPALPHTPEGLWQDHLRILDFFRRDEAVIALLERLAARYPMALISNGSGMMQRRKLAAAGLAGFFAQVWISGEQGMAKPDLRLFRQARAGLAGHRTVMIGDDPVNDIQPAQALGYATIHIGREPAAPATPADRTIPHILQLEEALACLT